VALLLAALGAFVLGGELHRMWTAAASRPDPNGESGRLKEEFLATVSHELRTPLNAILGWTELLRTPAALPPQEIGRGLEVIERNARRQLALVEELLAVADPERSRAEWQRIDLGALMHALLEHLEGPARAAEVALQEVPSPPEPDDEAAIWVFGDPAGLRLALRHILENALKFTPAGGHVQARLRRRGPEALIAVSDTGPGIDPAIGERVFEPFLRQDASATRAHGGLGLGLTIARRLIEAHGGRVDVRSSGAGQGSTFLVTLPRA
jgi:signal transduction histidine kinase